LNISSNIRCCGGYRLRRAAGNGAQDSSTDPECCGCERSLRNCGLLYEKEFRKALEPFARRLDFIYLTRLPFGKILEKVQNLPEHLVVLYYILIRNGEGKGFVPQEVASILAESTNAPVYGCLDSYSGDGIVGGRMTCNSFNRAY